MRALVTGGAASGKSAHAEQHASGVALLDDVGNLVSCALFDEAGNMADPDQTLERLTHELDAIFLHERSHAPSGLSVLDREIR